MKSPLAATLLGLLAATGATAESAKPTIVLVHGAFADSSSWNGVIEILARDGFPVVAVANPLRGVASDAAVTCECRCLCQEVVPRPFGGATVSKLLSLTSQT